MALAAARRGRGVRRTHENLIAVALLVFFAGVVWLCQDFGPRARMIPLPLAIFGIVLTTIQFVWQNLRSTDELRMDMVTVRSPAMPGQGEAAPDGGAAPDKPVTWREEARALGIVASLLVLTLTIGIIPAVFVFTGGYFALTRQYSWATSLLYTTCLTGAIYLLFVVALEVQLYHGWLAPLVERFR